MTLVKEAKEVAVGADTALQRPEVVPHGTPCGPDKGPDGAERTQTLYLQVDFDELPEEIAGHQVVRSLDPAADGVLLLCGL